MCLIPNGATMQICHCHTVTLLPKTSRPSKDQGEIALKEHDTCNTKYSVEKEDNMRSGLYPEFVIILEK